MKKKKPLKGIFLVYSNVNQSFSERLNFADTNVLTKKLYVIFSWIDI